jgi:hypothetical protein
MLVREVRIMELEADVKEMKRLPKALSDKTDSRGAPSMVLLWERSLKDLLDGGPDICSIKDVNVRYL